MYHVSCKFFLNLTRVTTGKEYSRMASHGYTERKLLTSLSASEFQ